jgi:hypothetical protein
MEADEKVEEVPPPADSEPYLRIFFRKLDNF